VLWLVLTDDCVCLQRVIGTELSFKTLGFASVIDFITAMPRVVAWERLSSGDWLLYDTNAPRPWTPPPSGMSRVIKVCLVSF